MRINKPGYRLNALDVSKIQEIEFGILKAFVHVCTSLGLRYYLHGGTLLGAVMYKDFIPWDDDIDVSMPREDYEVLLKEGQKLLPRHLFIQTCYNDKEYTLCFAKIRDTRTRLVEWSLQNRRKMVHGVYIDIFPIDGVKDRRKPLFVRVLRRRIDMSYWDVEKFNPLKKIAIALMVFPLLFISANKATRLLDTYRQRHRIKDEDNPPLMLVNRWYYPSEFYVPRPDNKVMFRNIEATTVRNPEKWLYIDYPHWPVVPPKEEQLPGHVLVEHHFE